MHDDALPETDELDIEALFRSETAKDLNALVNATGDGDWDSTALIAHRLRGRGRIMGYSRFEELAGQLESLADGREFGGIAEVLEALRERFEKMVSGDEEP